MVLVIIWAGLKYVPIDILRGDAGFFLTTDSIKPDESYRLRVQQNDLRIYEKRSALDPRVLCIGWYGDNGVWGDCVFIADYVAPIETPETPETLEVPTSKTKSWNEWGQTDKTLNQE